MNTDIVTLNVDPKTTQEIIETEFLLEVTQFVKKANLNAEMDLNVFTDSHNNQPTIGLSTQKFYSGFISKLEEKYNVGMITLEKSRFYFGFQKRKVSFMHLYIKPKEPIHVERLEDQIN